MAHPSESERLNPHSDVPADAQAKRRAATSGSSSTFESLLSKIGALLINRLELFLLEAGSAKQTVWTGLILSLLGVLSVFMASLFALLLIILAVPESWRIALLGGLTAFFVLFAVIALAGVHRALRTPWFGVSVDAVKTDWQTLTERQTIVPPAERPSNRESAHE